MTSMIQQKTDFIKSLSNYVSAAERFKVEKENFDTEKNLFESSAEGYFNLCGKDSIEVSGVDFGFSSIKERCTYLVTRVQRTSISWDIKKLKEKLGKKLSKDVLSKRYEIIDIDGLVEYLKECGVDPKRFKSYFNIDEFVNAKKIDELESLGKISKEQIDGCYSVACSKPYYQVRKKRHAAE